ncbi:hypothetical protein OLZ31_23630 [Enterobacter asburiae]|nr:hypothetical protein [Enterobacter asburiae]
MINIQYCGMHISQIAEEEFGYGFDPNERWPSLVLASSETVPAVGSSEWRLASEDCGGFSCDTFDAAVLPLSIRSQIATVLESIVEERFTSDGLDYFSMMDNQARTKIREAYLSVLHSVGLSCNEQNLKQLTQALYPVDATEMNLSILSDDQIDLGALQVSEGLVIFIVGQNCD